MQRSNPPNRQTWRTKQDVWKTRSRRQIAAGSWTRGNKGKNRKWRLQRRESATWPRTWKYLGIEIPVFQTTNSQRPTAKVKNMFFYSTVERKRKLKACNEKRSGIIRETLSLKLQGCCGEAKRPLPQKQNKKKCVLWHIVTKNERSAISKQPKSASQNTPFCPFSKGAQNYTNRIALIICALQTIFCVFVFLCLVF